MCPPTKTAKSGAKTQFSERKDYDLQDDFPTVQTMTSTSFLTVDSDPTAEETWNQFNSNNTVRTQSPDFVRSLRQMFASKPPGHYLVKVVATLEVFELDFEPQEGLSPDLEENTWCNADHTAGRPVTSTGQLEAQETPTLPWTEDAPLAPVGLAESEDFDPEQQL